MAQNERDPVERDDDLAAPRAGEGREQAREAGDHGWGRDPSDRDPGAHVDYYRGGDFGQPRTGPEGGFEEREDFRRTDRHADQGRGLGRDESTGER